MNGKLLQSAIELSCADAQLSGFDMGVQKTIELMKLLGIINSEHGALINDAINYSLVADFYDVKQAERDRKLIVEKWFKKIMELADG